jgi:glyceraldehyde 3-phosphate dehydrogenase
MKKRIAINGFGRIGRASARIILDKHADTMELVAINDPSPTEQTVHLFKYDTNFGTYQRDVKVADDEKTLIVDGHEIQNFSTRNIEDLPWGDLKIDVVLECTGVFRTKEGASKHLTQGAKKVVISAPAKSDGFTTVVLGVNEDILTGEETLISNASCTTNCLAPFAKVLHDEFEIKSGLMTTIHSYTTSQVLLDTGVSDLRRSRAAAENLIPASTGAAIAVGIVLPELKGKLNGMSVRVPMPTVSLVDLVVKVGRNVTKEEVNAVLKKASDANPEIIGYETTPLVSSDYKCESRSTVIDASETMVIDDMVKVLAWYDNEWGYSCRLVDLAEIV